MCTSIILLTPCSLNTNMPEEGKKRREMKEKNMKEYLIRGVRHVFGPHFLMAALGVATYWRLANTTVYAVPLFSINN